MVCSVRKVESSRSFSAAPFRFSRLALHVTVRWLKVVFRRKLCRKSDIVPEEAKDTGEFMRF